MILPAVAALVALSASAREGDVALDLSKAINDGHAPQCFKPGERDAAGVKFRIVDPSKDGRLGYVAFADIRSPKRPVSVTAAPSAPTEAASVFLLHWTEKDHRRSPLVGRVIATDEGGRCAVADVKIGRDVRDWWSYGAPGRCDNAAPGAPIVTNGPAAGCAYVSEFRLPKGFGKVASVELRGSGRDFAGGRWCVMAASLGAAADPAAKLAAAEMKLVPSSELLPRKAAERTGEWAPVEIPIMTEFGRKVTPENAYCDYPRPQLVRTEWTRLNGLWDYAIVESDSSFTRPPAWDGKILVPYPVESALSGVGRPLAPSDVLWYHRTFTAKREPHKRVIIHFEAVDQVAQVFVNGAEALEVPHEGGQVPFAVDVTDWLKEGENDLFVAVRDFTTANPQGFATGKQMTVFSRRNDEKLTWMEDVGGIFYTQASGIWQSVWMESVYETRVTGYETRVDLGKGEVAVKVDVVGNPLGGEVTLEVLKDGERVAKEEVEDLNGWTRLKLPRPVALWTPETPALYDLRITVEDDAADTVDVATGYFAMRTVGKARDAQGNLRFTLNGRETFLHGTLDQGWWPEGLLTPPSEEAMAFDIRTLKACGFNMMRKHIKVEPARYYRLCDELGLMVLQDMPSGVCSWDPYRTKVPVIDQYAVYRREFAAVYEHLKGFPCIVAWVPYNEGWTEPNAGAVHWTFGWLKRKDPTRLVDGPSGWIDYDSGVYDHKTPADPGKVSRATCPEEYPDFHDLHCYPGPDMHPAGGDRISLLGEFGGIGLRVKGHVWSPGGQNWGYVMDSEAKAAQDRFLGMVRKLDELKAKGLGGSVYTQTTDVEGELNGLMTYDRVLKFDAERVKTASESLLK